MDTTIQAQVSDHIDTHPVAITVTVNNHPVTFHQHHATGAVIKSTAIAQGVAIEQDFKLFEVEGAGRLKPIGDAEEVALHPEQVFRAVTPDNNS